MRLLILLAAIFVPLVASAEESLKTISVNDIKIIKISGNDGKAVIKTPDRTLQIIRTGDQIGYNGRVADIDGKRIVIEQLTDKGTETVIIRVEKGQQTIERIRKIGNEQQNLFAPK